MSDTVVTDNRLAKARVIQKLLGAAEHLHFASSHAVQALDEQLFKDIVNITRQVNDLVESLVKP